ncbi:MAG: hypothetical protein NZM37_08910, partial [Sandaracinaceae bacterium]|nr:hypothetical protein [Sandaracinaceae bacterium]
KMAYNGSNAMSPKFPSPVISHPPISCFVSRYVPHFIVIGAEDFIFSIIAVFLLPTKTKIVFFKFHGYRFKFCVYHDDCFWVDVLDECFNVFCTAYFSFLRPFLQSRRGRAQCVKLANRFDDP